MNVTVCHSHQERCGIREYGSQLDRSLGDLGVQVHPCSYAFLGEVVAQMKPGSIFLTHFEPGLVTPWYLNQYLKAARDRGAKTVMCCHWYEYEFMQQYVDLTDQFVIHREYPARHMQSTVIPLGCPVYDPPPDRSALRSRFDLPANATVLTTVGFLTRWKLMPEIAHAVLGAVAQYPDVHVRVHTPWPYDDTDAKREEDRVREVLRPHAGRASLSTEFLSEGDLLDLVRASDLGFVYHGFDTWSVSAATKQFVSARRPLVVTGSSHASDLTGGIVRTHTFDPVHFAQSVASVVANRTWTAYLQKEMEQEYERLNMTAVAKRYIDLFEKLLS